MPWKLYIFIIFTFFLKCGSFTQSRRISFGQKTITDKRYMVYLLQSEKSNTTYDHWLCAGVIVSPTHILTSAACLIDVTYIYVIAGYKKYVRKERLNEDNCTRRHKNKVIKTCIPRTYKFSYENTSDWFHLDIGFAIVAKPYDFSDLSYRDYCSYVPGPIRINYNPRYTTEGMQAVLYGWGHPRFYRSPNDYQDYNEEYMREGMTVIINKTICSENYLNISHSMIDNYMICCWGKGLFDSEGIPREIVPEYNNGINRRILENTTDDFVYHNITNKGNLQKDAMSLKTYPKAYASRRQGICQNDHGVPLVAWIGAHEYTLGVGSTFLVVNERRCSGPYMYTSTQCASRFIRCALKDKSSTFSIHYHRGMRVSLYSEAKKNLDFDVAPIEKVVACDQQLTRKMCDNMGIEEGYELHETEIDWTILDGNVNDEKNVVTELPKPSENEDGKDIFKLDLNDSQNDPINSFENNDGGFINLDSSHSENQQNDAVNDFLKGDVITNLNENKKSELRDTLVPTFGDKSDFDTDDVVVI